eukprot:SM000116S24244  [mRNA]  locus=s116:191412:195001:- [translate_table: standard]
MRPPPRRRPRRPPGSRRRPSAAAVPSTATWPSPVRASAAVPAPPAPLPEGNYNISAVMCKPLSIETLPDLAKGSTSALRVAYQAMHYVGAPSHTEMQFGASLQGMPGAYSESAASKAYPNCEPVPCEQFDAAFQVMSYVLIADPFRGRVYIVFLVTYSAVELWLVDRAVLPIENSLGGSIHRNYDLLIRHRLHIVGEVQLPIHHCLLALPGTKLSDVRRVISHPQALAQCEMTLAKYNLAREAVDDTAGAAQASKRTLAMRSTELPWLLCRSQYNCQATAEDVTTTAGGLFLSHTDGGIRGPEDEEVNVTRFLMLAREPVMPRTDRPFRTSIVFSLEEGPGILFKALSVFALRDINLSKIESRPQRRMPLPMAVDNGGKPVYFDYLFFVDFEASMAEPRGQNALRHLQEFAPFLKVLGSYPMDTGARAATSSSSSPPPPPLQPPSRL